MAHVEEQTGTRRDFLYVATGAVGGIATAAAVWPLINQMNPSADVQALASIQVDVSGVEEGSQLTVKFLGKPVFIRRRTAEEISDAREVELDQLPDTLARNANRPADTPATDENRTMDEAGNWLVMIGVCTHLGCVPLERRRRLQRLVLPLPRLDLRHLGADPQRPGPGEPAYPGCLLHLRHRPAARPGSRSMSGIPHDHYEPKTRWEKWIESRLPILGLLHATLFIPTPKNLNWMWVWGIVLTFCLALQIATGVVLVMHYTPSVAGAFASVEHIMRDVNGGWALRYVHANGASLFFFAVYCHIFRGIYYGSYKTPREITWIIGMLIYLAMMATAFMGYVLPWGQMSFWGATVITGLFGAIPLVGVDIQTWLLGGPAVDNPTLTRFFSLHYLLPFVIAGLVILHIWAFHTTGNNNPTGVEVRRGSKAEAEKDTLPFWPYFVIKDLFALVFVLVIFAAIVGFMPNFLGHPDNYIEANPLKTPAHIVPGVVLPAVLRDAPGDHLRHPLDQLQAGGRAGDVRLASRCC